MSSKAVTPIIFAGRTGDRNGLAMQGAAVVGTALADAVGRSPIQIGTPSPPLAEGWEAELEAARAGLLDLRLAVTTALAAGQRPLLTNGRCAASLATLPAVVGARPDAVVVWFDAHGDCNTPEHTTTGYLGGMVLTGAAGRWETGLGSGLDLERVILVGSRDLDPIERRLIDEGVMRLVEAGPDLPARLRAAIGNRPLFMHLDCDVLEPGLVPSEYQVPGGLSLEELAEACAAMAECEVVGLEVAEFEATWPNGAPGEPDMLVRALAPLLTAM